MKWWYLPVALSVVSGCATAPAPVAARPEPVAAPAAFDDSQLAISDEFKPVALQPAPAPAPLFAPGTVAPGFTDATPAEAAPAEPAHPAAPKAPVSASRRSAGEGSLVARSGR